MIEVSLHGSNEIVADFGEAPQTVTKALVRALNRSIKSGRTLMVRNIAGDTALRSKDVRDAMRLREASLGRPEASLGTSLKRIPLYKFRAKGPFPSRGKGRGVSYRLGNSTGRLPHAFIARMASGHMGVFMRKGEKRLPIQEKFGPSLGHVFRKYRPEGIARTMEAFETNFDHELGFARRQASPAGQGSEDA